MECIQKNTDVCEKTYCLLQDATKNLNVLTTGDMFNTNIVCLSENKRYLEYVIRNKRRGIYEQKNKYIVQRIGSSGMCGGDFYN